MQVGKERHEPVRVILGDRIEIMVGIVATVARLWERHDKKEARDGHVCEHEMTPVALWLVKLSITLTQELYSRKNAPPAWPQTSRSGGQTRKHQQGEGTWLRASYWYNMGAHSFL